MASELWGRRERHRCLETLKFGGNNVCRLHVHTEICLVDYLLLKALQCLETDMAFMSSLISYGWLIKNILSQHQTQDHSNRGKEDMRETQIGFFPRH